MKLVDLKEEQGEWYMKNEALILLGFVVACVVALSLTVSFIVSARSVETVIAAQESRTVPGLPLGQTCTSDAVCTSLACGGDRTVPGHRVCGELIGGKSNGAYHSKNGYTPVTEGRSHDFCASGWSEKNHCADPRF